MRDAKWTGALVENRHETLARAGTANRFHDEQRQLGFSSGLAQSKKLYLCSTVVETKTEYLWHAQDEQNSSSADTARKTAREYQNSEGS
jgi:hypothetical protein